MRFLKNLSNQITRVLRVVNIVRVVTAFIAGELTMGLAALKLTVICIGLIVL